MLGYCPLASGSRGNCIYVGTRHARILIDAGISAKHARESLVHLGVSLDQIDAIVISHEHTDHIRGLKSIAQKRGIPIFANSETAKAILADQGSGFRFKIFSNGEPFVIGDVEIHPFSIPHDAVDPVAFTLQCGRVKLGLCTDLGFASPHIHHCLQEADFLYLESNHDRDMVLASARPDILKRRILGRNGHLSNGDCGKLLCAIASPRLKHVHLAHLSPECNTPEMALNTVETLLRNSNLELSLDVAPQQAMGRIINWSSLL